MESLQQCKSVGEMEPNTILEVQGGRLIESLHDRVVLASVTYAQDDKTTFSGRMMIPPRVFGDRLKLDDVIEPCVMVYLGKKTLEKEGHTCFDLKSVEIPEGKTQREYVDELRTMSHDELSSMFKIASFADFQAGTVFVAERLRLIKTMSKDEVGLTRETKVPVMTYETTVGGDTVKGEIFLPHRTYLEVKRKLPSVIIYNGQRKAKKGCRTYFDLTVLDDSFISTLEEAATDAAAADPETVVLSSDSEDDSDDAAVAAAAAAEIPQSQEFPSSQDY